MSSSSSSPRVSRHAPEGDAKATKKTKTPPFSTANAAADPVSSPSNLRKKNPTDGKANNNCGNSNKNDGGSNDAAPSEKRIYTQEEIAAAAAEAQRVLQQPRYVAIAEEEERAQAAAQARIRKRILHEPDTESEEDDDDYYSRRGRAQTYNSHNQTEEIDLSGEDDDHGAYSDGDEAVGVDSEPEKIHGQPGRKSAKGRASQSSHRGAKTHKKGKGGKDIDEEAGAAGEADGSPTSEQKKKTTAGKKRGEQTAADAVAEVSAKMGETKEKVVSMAHGAIARQRSEEAKQLKASVSTLKALLRECGISTRVVPVVPMDACTACDFIVLFSDKASVEAYFGRVVRALCVAGMKVIYTAPKPEEEGQQQQQQQEEQEQKKDGKDGNADAEDAAAAAFTANKRSAQQQRSGERRMRSMYCFYVEAVPVSGNAEVVSLHVTLRPGMGEIFYGHYIQHYNKAGAAGGGRVDGTDVDSPFPPTVAELTDAQRKRMLYYVVSHLVHEKAAVPPDTQHVALFPAHVDAMRDSIWEACMAQRSPWGFWRGTDEDAIAAYFGEETMFYFAWMNHYQRWLAAASVFTLFMTWWNATSCNSGGSSSISNGHEFAGKQWTTVVVGVLEKPAGAGDASDAVLQTLNNSVLHVTAAAAAIRRGAGTEEAGAAFHLSLYGKSLSALSGVASASSSSWMCGENSLPFFILVLVLGSVLCIKMWQRRCNTIRMRYGLFQSPLLGKDELRREFRGRAGRNPITEQEELQFPAWVRGLILQPLAWTVIALFACATLAVMVGFVNLEGYTAVDDETGAYGFAVIPWLRRFSLPGGVFNQRDHPLTAVLPTICYPACIAALSALFKSLAETLTNFENYKYRGEHIRALTQKRVVFELINSYAKLFFLALVSQSVTGLSKSLRSIFITSVFMRLIMDTVLPFLSTHRRQVAQQIMVHQDSKDKTIENSSKNSSNGQRSASNDKQTATTSENVARHGGSVDSALDEADELLSTYEVYSDYVEMAIQFGYIVLFAAAFPLAPIVALVSNIIEMRSDLFKLCYVVRRPVPRLGIAENNTWAGVFRLMALASVATNILLFAVSAAPTIARFLPSCFAYRFSTQYLKGGESVAVLATPELIKGMGRYAVLSGVLMEHVVVGMAGFLFWRISDFPKKVSVHIERRQYERALAQSTPPQRRRLSTGSGGSGAVAAAAAK